MSVAFQITFLSKFNQHVVFLKPALTQITEATVRRWFLKQVFLKAL